MRIVIVSQMPTVVTGLTTLLRAMGHEPVASMSCAERGIAAAADVREDGRSALRSDTTHEIVERRRDITTRLRRYQPDLVLCAGFPWKMPPDALAVPRFGAVNGHASLLPRYRGPIPVAWAIRNGEPETGFTFHRMEDTFDSGPILAQAPIPIAEEQSWDELQPKLSAVLPRLLRQTLRRVERGEVGERQDPHDGSYFGWFEPEYGWIDWTRTAAEIRRQVRAWQFAGPLRTPRPLARVGERTVHVHRVSLTPMAGTAVACADGPVWIASSSASEERRGPSCNT